MGKDIQVLFFHDLPNDQLGNIPLQLPIYPFIAKYNDSI